MLIALNLFNVTHYYLTSHLVSAGADDESAWQTWMASSNENENLSRSLSILDASCVFLARRRFSIGEWECRWMTCNMKTVFFFSSLFSNLILCVILLSPSLSPSARASNAGAVCDDRCAGGRSDATTLRDFCGLSVSLFDEENHGAKNRTRQRGEKKTDNFFRRLFILLLFFPDSNRVLDSRSWASSARTVEEEARDANNNKDFLCVTRMRQLTAKGIQNEIEI